MCMDNAGFSIEIVKTSAGQSCPGRRHGAADHSRIEIVPLLQTRNSQFSIMKLYLSGAAEQRSRWGGEQGKIRISNAAGFGARVRRPLRGGRSGQRVVSWPVPGILRGGPFVTCIRGGLCWIDWNFGRLRRLRR